MSDNSTTKKVADLLWSLGVGMLIGWSGLYLFLVYALTHGGKIQKWHSTVWIVATFLGTMMMVLGQKTVCEWWKVDVLGWKGEIKVWCSVLGSQLVKTGLLTIIGLALPLFFSWVLSHYTDFSWDGMTVRGITVRNLMEGEPSLNAYPFGHVLAGFLSHITGSWQAGKGINLTLIWICFCFVFPTLQGLSFTGWKLWILSIFTALCPVAVYQISSFQVDGHVASIITCLLFSMLKTLASGPVRSEGVLALVSSFTAAASCKNSGVFYAIIISGIFLLFFACLKRSWRQVPLLLVVAVFVSWPFGVYIRSIGLCNPLTIDYLKTVTSSGPGYGFSGGASEVLSIQKMNRMQQFAASAFSQTEITPTDVHIKFPFQIGRREIRVFEELTPDPRAGGFGPWYGTAFLLAGIGCFLLVLNGQANYWPGWFLFLATAASSFGSQVWWARWTPQNWLLLIAMLMTVLAAGFKSCRVDGLSGTVMRWLGGLACLATGINVFLVTLYYLVGMVKQEKILNLQIELAATFKTPVLIHIPVITNGHNSGKSFQSSKWWFAERGVPIMELQQEPPRPRMKIHKTETRFPLPPDWRFSLRSPEDEALFRKKNLIED